MARLRRDLGGWCAPRAARPRAERPVHLLAATHIGTLVILNPSGARVKDLTHRSDAREILRPRSTRPQNDGEQRTGDPAIRLDHKKSRGKCRGLKGEIAFPRYFCFHAPLASWIQWPGLASPASCCARWRPTISGVAPVLAASAA